MHVAAASRHRKRKEQIDAGGIRTVEIDRSPEPDERAGDTGLLDPAMRYRNAVAQACRAKPLALAQALENIPSACRLVTDSQQLGRLFENGFLAGKVLIQQYPVGAEQICKRCFGGHHLEC